MTTKAELKKTLQQTLARLARAHEDAKSLGDGARDVTLALEDALIALREAITGCGRTN